MLMVQYRAVFFIVALTVVFITGVVTVEAQQTATGSQSELKHGLLEGSYLDRVVARRKSAEYNLELKRDIRRLYILIANYGNTISGSQDTYNQIKDHYGEALINWHRRRYLESYNAHKEAREKVTDLYWKFAAHYRQQVEVLLEDSSRKLVDAEIAEIIEPEQIFKSPPLHVLRTTFKLRIAYGQTYLAEKMQRVEQPGIAIQHYRLAKIFAIEVLKALELDKGKRKAIEDKYRHDLRDSKGIPTRKITQG